MNNIGIVIGAVIISITIFFTFGKESSEQVQVDKKGEYKLLEEKVAVLQNKILTLNENSEKIDGLKDEIKSLEYKLSLKKIKDNPNKNVIKDTPMIYDYLKYTKAKPIEKGIRLTANGTPYVIYGYNEETVDNVQKETSENIPPPSPSLASINVDDEKIYYQVKVSQPQKISVLSVSPSTKQEVLTNQSDTVDVIEGSPPVPPSLFEGSSIPQTN